MEVKKEIKTVNTMTDDEKLAEYTETKAAVDSIGTVFIFTENDGTWFLYDEKNPKSAEICLRSLSLEEIKEMRKKFIKTKVVYKRDQRYAFEDPDSEGQNDFIWSKSIVDWRRVIGEGGKEIPCNDIEKVRLMNTVPSFLKWVTKCMTSLGEAEYEQVEVERKN